MSWRNFRNPAFWTNNSKGKVAEVLLFSGILKFRHSVFSISLPQKTYNSPLNGCQIVCSKSFIRPGQYNELQIYGNFPLIDNKHRKLFVIKQSEGCKFMPTRSSAIAEGPRDASCQLKSCQLPRNSAETTYTTSPDHIDGMKLEI